MKLWKPIIILTTMIVVLVALPGCATDPIQITRLQEPLKKMILPLPAPVLPMVVGNDFWIPIDAKEAKKKALEVESGEEPPFSYMALTHTNYLNFSAWEAAQIAWSQKIMIWVEDMMADYEELLDRARQDREDVEAQIEEQQNPPDKGIFGDLFD